MKKKSQDLYKHDGQDRFLPRLSLFMFEKSRMVSVVWLCLAVFGVFSYTSLLQREGFPSVNIPFSFVKGTYFVNDPERVDKEVAKPVGEIILKDKRVKAVESNSQGAFYTIMVEYTQETNAEQAGKEIEKRIKDSGVLPDQAVLDFESPKFGFTDRGDDAVISVYAKQDGVSVDQLYSESDNLVNFLKQRQIADIESVSVVDPFVRGVGLDGQEASVRTKFDRYGERQDGKNTFYNSIAVGIMQKDGTDVIELDDQLRQAIADYKDQNPSSQFDATLSASYAPDIKEQIGVLQQVLLEGLLAVLIIGSIIIALRASVITVLAMITVLAISLSILVLMGESLNTITLFALILCLGLIVDDTIIMIEAIDAQRRRLKDAKQAVEVATRRVSRAMVAATSTAVLSFAPLLFVSGILGSFIRAIPTTVIIALIVSLFVALIFIPVFARILLLKKMGKEVKEPAARVEAKIAAFIARPMIWAKSSKKRLFAVGSTAVLVSMIFVIASGFLFQKVTFNIFPPSKDSNGVTVTMDFAPGTTIEQAEAIADKADKIVADNTGDNFKHASYYANAGTRTSMLVAQIIPYNERDITAPEIVANLEKKFEGFSGAEVTVRQLDVGPPTEAFAVRIEADDRQAALRLAGDVQVFLGQLELVRPSGEKARVSSISVSDSQIYSRDDGKLFVEVRASFDATDTSTLVLLAQSALDKEYTKDKLNQYGLKEDALGFSFGQEEENQNSFKALAYAFPIMLLAVFVLLAIEFRSLLQPLLIFMAIPFSLLGVTLGLYLTDNAFSFFTMLGFFALIGLSIKNTILLTDYANQLRRAGAGAVDSAVGALEERFRPLVATSLTAVVSLIPLSLASPFWEGLAVVLIGGLLSSTFLVIAVFPYFYLGGEYLRLRISRKSALLWLSLTIIVSVAAGIGGANPGLIPVWAILLAVFMVIFARIRASKRSA